MPKRNLVLTTVISLCLSAGAMANQSVINVNARPGGLSGQTAEVLAQSSSDSSAAMTVQYLGNCKIGEKKYSQQNSDVFVMSLGSTVTGKCSFDVKEHNLLRIPYAQSLSICHDRSRQDLGEKHFRDDSQSKILVTTRFFHGVATSWVQDLGLTNTKVISMGRSTDVNAASFGREGDYFALDSTTAAQQQSRLSCIFTTHQDHIPGIAAPTLRAFDSAVRYPEVYAVQLVTISGSQDRDQWQRNIDAVLNHPQWIQYSQRPGIRVIPKDQQWQFFQNQVNILRQTRP